MKSYTVLHVISIGLCITDETSDGLYPFMAQSRLLKLTNICFIFKNWKIREKKKSWILLPPFSKKWKSTESNNKLLKDYLKLLKMPVQETKFFGKIYPWLLTYFQPLTEEWGIQRDNSQYQGLECLYCCTVCFVANSVEGRFSHSQINWSLSESLHHAVVHICM